MKSSTLRRYFQILFFFLFIYLLNRTEYTGTQELKYPVKLFLDIDPLIAIATFFTSYTVPLLLWLSVFTLLFTFVFGRFFCVVHLSGPLLLEMQGFGLWILMNGQ